MTHFELIVTYLVDANARMAKLLNEYTYLFIPFSV